MAGQLKLRRGTTSQLANYIGSEGELTYDTALKSLVLHDGATLGGVKIPYLSNDLVPPTMLPTATESVVGTSKIATTAIARAGGNDTDFITPLKLKGCLDTKVLGINQTWQDVAASRAINTTYTNSTGKPIFIAIGKTTQSSDMRLFVNVIQVGYASGANQDSQSKTLYAIVPSGETYGTIGSSGFVFWSELR